MTDLKKAKQCAAWILSNCAAKYVSPEVFSSNPQVVIDKMIEEATEKVAAYASHSNSELLERVQKLEQQIDEKLEFAKSMHDQCSNVNSYLAGWADGAIETLNELKEWAKAPETRNV